MEKNKNKPSLRKANKHISHLDDYFWSGQLIFTIG